MDTPRNKNKAVGTRFQGKAILEKYMVKRLPVFGVLQLRQAVTLYPPCQGFHIPCPFHLGCRTRTCLRLGNVIIRNQSEFLLKLCTNTSQGLFVVVRLVHGERCWMDFVDRQVNMVILSITVQYGNTLMVVKSQRITGPLFHFSK